MNCKHFCPGWPHGPQPALNFCWQGQWKRMVQKNKKTEQAIFCWQGQWILNAFTWHYFLSKIIWIWKTCKINWFCQLLASIGPFLENTIVFECSPCENNERVTLFLSKLIKSFQFLKISKLWLSVFIGLLSKITSKLKDLLSDLQVTLLQPLALSANAPWN